MKNYEEVTRSLLERRDRYEAQRSRNRRMMLSVAVSLCCFCLIVGAGVFMGRNGKASSVTPTTVIEDAVYPGVTDYFDDKHGQSLTEPSAINKIVIHSIDGVASEIMNIALMRGDFIEMTRQELVDYYGVDYFPEVPADLPMMEIDNAGIFRRYGGTGEVYWDQNTLEYTNVDYTRMVGVSVNKGNRVFQQFLFFEGTEEKSVINDMEILIGLTEEGYYYSEFMLGDVGFLVSAYGVTEAEFVAIIASVLS
jgi:hypothetical protein